MLSPDVPTFSVSICAYFAPYPSMWISACVPIFWQVFWAKMAPYTTPYLGWGEAKIAPAPNIMKKLRIGAGRRPAPTF